MLSEAARPLRCAVYTRKSSDEGLEQSFNALDAQFESCSAYIKSQSGENWAQISSRYDDAGYSGASMNRPGLKALMRDIDRGLVDTVVVYKIDRLTRSISDFMKLAEIFESKTVSIVAVTQAFNTTTSMGRLTLNMLLSFAQFERDITSERQRDKREASRKRGLWMGGVPPLGYDVVDKTLVPNAIEAETVRQIYARYLELKSILRLMADLHSRGIESKRHITNSGQQVGDGQWWYVRIRKLLSNRVYVGEVLHKGVHYPGVHQPIVSSSLFQNVQDLLNTNGNRPRSKVVRRSISLFPGLVFDDAGNRMTAKLSGQSASYESQAYLQRRELRCSLYRLSVRRLDEFLVTQLEKFAPNSNRSIGLDPGPSLPRGEPDNVFATLSSAIDFVNVQRRDLAKYVKKIVVGMNNVDLQIEPAPKGLPPLKAVTFESCGGKISSYRWEIGFKVCLASHRLKSQVGIGSTSSPDWHPRNAQKEEALIKALVVGHSCQRAVIDGTAKTMADLVRLTGLTRGCVTRIMRLAHLDPTLQVEILNGKRPYGLTVGAICQSHAIPVDWAEQRDFLRRLNSVGNERCPSPEISGSTEIVHKL